LLLLASACACAAAPAPPPLVAPAAPPASAPAASAAQGAPPAPPPRVEHPRATDPRWLAARDSDPLEKARLAVAVGAAGLVAGLDDGGETADTALAALPYAEDAEVALGRLAELARSPASPRRRVLAAILGVAGQPRRPREPLDPEGARRCGDAVLAIAADASLPREERAIAVSAARALAERGYVDRARIPSALDR
jgi:hypothetical protein